jgi:putative transposase
MIRTLKVRLYPNVEQKVLLEKHFGSCRFVWNHFLEVRNRYYIKHRNERMKGPSVFDTMKTLTELKKETT